MRLRDTKGLHHLACLLQAPGRAFHVLDLPAMTDHAPAVAVASSVGTDAGKPTPESEKVRKAVTNRIRAALAQIKKAHPALWRHLYPAIKTGRLCSYQPETAIVWKV